MNTTEEEIEDFLEHFGVKGMKWGVRRRDRSPQGQADRAKLVADRRPTKSNIRRAQQAQRVADRRSNPRDHKVLKIAEEGDWRSRSKKQKAALVAGGLAGVIASGEVITRMMGTKMPMVQLGLQAAGGVAAVRVTRDVLDKRGETKLNKRAAKG